MVVLTVFLFISCEIEKKKPEDKDKIDTTRTLPKDKSEWTFIYYYNADNNLESFMVEDINEVKKNIKNDNKISVVVLIDRIQGYSDDSGVFGEDFTDTRLYEIIPNGVIRLNGKSFFENLDDTNVCELNLGDISNLKKLIQFSKYNYPAEKYCLVIGNHGTGINEISNYGNINYAISYDDTNKSFIKIGEFTDKLASEDSVDLLVFDACQMNYIEIAYQISPELNKFYTNYFVAASTEEVAEGFCYDYIFQAINNYYDNNSNILPEIDLGNIFVNEQKKYLQEIKRVDQAYSFLDLKKVKVVKNKLDEVAPKIAQKKEQLKITTGENISSTYVNENLIIYFNNGINKSWINYANFDIYSFFNNLKNDNSFSDILMDIDFILSETDNMIISSFGGSKYKNFIEGKNGLSFFLPRGSSLYYSKKHWSYQNWFHPNKLLWCKDNSIKENGLIENWFELYDYWFDVTDDTGGYNSYIF